MANNSQSRTARRKQKKNKKKPLWKKILFTLLIICLVIGIGVAALSTYWIATAPEIDASMLSDPFPSEILDKDGEVFASLGAESRTKVEFDELPEVLIDAVTATEDARFFDHPGVDIRRVGGAVIANITNGFGSEGASTITQQVVEKSFLTPDKKISIKVQEMWLALKLEREYSKEEIMEMYLNKIYYGSGAYGAAKATEIYFGKTDLSELTLPEAAILAGLPQRPSAYNPFENPELMKDRMNTVLSLMVRHGKISEEQAEEASQVDISSLLTDSRPDTIQYEAFLQQVNDEVSEKVDGADIYTDGLTIHTTLDTDAQEHVEYLLSDESPINYPDEDLQAGMTILDTENGAIRAIGGARGGLENDGWNYAINGGEQPGSAIKPIMSYGPAIEYNQWSTYHQINDDEPYPLGNGHAVNNFDRQFHGWVSMRSALSNSYNVPALKTAEEVGMDNAMEFSEKLGIPIESRGITEAIGGADTLVTPLQMAGAFRPFGNEGIYNEPYAVSKVEFPDGETVELQPEPEAVMADSTAYMITDMLQTTMTEGTGTSANVPGLPEAGKTGTTNLEDGSAGDAWFSGYTTNYTISVWTGYPQNDPLTDTSISRQLFKNAMTEISEGIDTPDFEKPDSVVEVEVEKGSNPAALPSPHTPSSEIVTELFVKGSEPTSTSEKFDQLDPVNSLSAEYNEDSNSVNVEWNYDSNADVSFEVSASENGGQMQSLSSTEETSLEISDVEPGTDYEIQVVVVDSNDESNTSEASSTSITVPDGENDEENGGEIGSVEGLNGTYNEENQIIDVTWQYNGPPAEFEVSVNGQTQTVSSNGMEISGIQPGQTYTINVTPIGQNGENADARGDTQSTEVTVPEEETNEETDNEEENSNEEENANDEETNNEEENGSEEEPDTPVENGSGEESGNEEENNNNEEGSGNGEETTNEEENNNEEQDSNEEGSE